MKHCPSCRTQYTDDTLKFCLQDGTALIEVFSTATPTVVFDEKEIAVSNRGQMASKDSQETRWRQSEVTRISSLLPETEKSKTAIAVFLTAFAMLVAFGFVSVGAWLYFRNGQSEIAKNNTNTSVENVMVNAIGGSNMESSPVPGATRTPVANIFTPSNTARSYPPSQPPPTLNEEQVKGDVSRRIYSWKSQAESQNLDSYMSNYADSVDYYNKRGASRGFVRSDKQRAFAMFNSMRIDISNISITTDSSGETATAAFDKTWVFDGAKRNSGKVRSRLQLKRINGQWLITGERDLKVYYLNK